MEPHFCTCGSTDCRHHPSSHEQGCTPCIRKNLAKGEIPSCFWLKVSPNGEDGDDFSIPAFAAFVQMQAGER